MGKIYFAKRRFWNGIYSLLMRAEARASADTILHVTHIDTLLAGHC